MVEIEEITDSDVNTEDNTIKASDTIKKNNTNNDPKKQTKKTQQKKMVPRKELPSVAHMLAHGSPESQGRPKTFCDVFGYPIFVAICFAISLLIFHYAPHDKSVQPRGKFSVPQRRSSSSAAGAGRKMAVPLEEKVVGDSVRHSPPVAAAGDGEL